MPLEFAARETERIAMKRLVILGAGYGGLALAKKLDSISRGQNRWDINLIDQRDYHLIQVRIHEVAANSIPVADVRVPFPDLLHDHHVRLTQAKILKIDPVAKQVHTTAGEIGYDRLVVGLGSTTDYHDIEGMAEYSYPMKDLEDAVSYRKAVIQAFREATAPGAAPLRKNDPRLTFVIIGGGLTGTELAAEMVDFCADLSHRFPAARSAYRIVLVESGPHLLSQLGPDNGDYIKEQLLRKNVVVLTNTFIDRMVPGLVHLSSGKLLKSNIVCWAGGVKAPAIIKESGFETSKDGRIPVNAYLQSKQFKDVYALGDNALALDPRSGKPIPQTGQYAERQGWYLADCFAAELTGVKPQPYQPFSLGISVSLGRREALTLTGPLRLTGTAGRIAKDASYSKYELGLRELIPEI